MIVKSNILGTSKELASIGIDIDKLKSDLTLPNSEYKNLLRFGRGRFYKKVDPYICYLKKVGDTYISKHVSPSSSL